MKPISLEHKQLTVWLSIKAVSKDSDLDPGEIKSWSTSHHLQASPSEYVIVLFNTHYIIFK